MTIKFLVITSMLVSEVASAEPSVHNAFDHLMPVDLKANPKYRDIWTSKLAVTPFDCGRVVFLPPFDPEGTISVYSMPQAGGTSYRATYIAVERNLWQWTDAVHEPVKANSVAVKRWDADIPERTAQLVRRAWLGMLSGPYGPKSIPPSPEVVEVDATHAEFSLEMPNRAPLYGELDLSSSLSGQRTKLLVEIWNHLYDYCKAPLEKRDQIADKIDQAATALLAQLK